MNTRAITTFFLLVLSSLSVLAGDSRFYAVEDKATPKEQLALAAVMARRALQEQDPAAKRDAVNFAALHYEVVLVKWPDDRMAKLGALLGQADLFLNSRRIENAEEVLLEALPLATGTLDEVQVRVKIGEATFRNGKRAEAEKSYRSAEETARVRGNASLERMATVAAATFFSDIGSNHEAAARFRALAGSEDVEPSDRALYAVKAADQPRKISKDDRFANDIALAKHLIARARRESNANRQRQLDITEQYLARVIR